MDANKRRFLLILPLTCGLTLGFQADADRDKDVYAIYSLMLTNPYTSHGPDDNARYLIAAATVPGVPKDPCVRPPKQREAEFREVLADFEKRKATPRQLQRDLSIQKPYILLSAADVKAFTDARSTAHIPPDAPDERFRGVADLFTLTDVYFNPHRTLALTAIASWCGNLCAAYQWKVFEKLASGRWQELDWTACATMARQ
jgi:hypothetical protein